MIDLLKAILADSPRLEGSLCRDRSALFDAEQEDEDDRQFAVDSAKRLCRQCPALQACREWAATQPRLTGVVAGELHHFNNNRGKKKAS
jgi:Transcription factor WhiB